MSSNDLDNAALKLVQEFLKTRDTEYENTWTVTQAGQPTGEEVVMMMYRLPKEQSKIFKEAFKSLPIATLPAGNICPRCHGTGRA